MIQIAKQPHIHSHFLSQGIKYKQSINTMILTIEDAHKTVFTVSYGNKVHQAVRFFKIKVGHQSYGASVKIVRLAAVQPVYNTRKPSQTFRCVDFHIAFGVNHIAFRLFGYDISPITVFKRPVVFLRLHGHPSRQEQECKQGVNSRCFHSIIVLSISHFQLLYHWPGLSRCRFQKAKRWWL